MSFSIDINSANGANYIRPKKGAGQNPAAVKTPVDMTKNGSVFNDPNIFSAEPTQTSPSITTVRRQPQQGTQKGGSSIFNGQMNFVSGGNSGSGSPSGINSLTAGVDPSIMGGKESAGNDDLGIGRDAGKGREAAKALKEQTSDLKNGIHDIESREDDAKNIGKKGKKLQASIKKTDEKFKEKEAKQKAEFQKLEDERRAVMQEMDDANKSIEDYSRELEAELEAGSGNFERIATLRSAIREKSSTITIGQSKVNVIGRSSKALVNEMTRTSKTYIKTNKTHQKNLDKNQQKLEKTLEVAAEIEGISSIVETTGAIIENLGRVFKACAGIPVVGAALAAAGTVMQPIGATGKAVGQWGKTAAQITQTVAYASAGMVQQAFMSAASALQTGSQAFSSSKAAVAGFKNLGSELDAVTSQSENVKAKGDAVANKSENVESTGEAGETDGTPSTDGTTGTDNVENPDKTTQTDGTDSTKGAEGTDATDGTKDTKGADGKTGTEKTTGDAKTDGADAKKADAAAAKKTEAKVKSKIKQTLLQDGMAVVGQALTVAASICAMTASNSAKSGKGHQHSDFQISARAQKIVAQTMSKMGYSGPGRFTVRTR